MKKLTTLFSVLCLTLALTVPASALDYNIDGPGDPEYGKSTSIEPVVTADRSELPKVDVINGSAGITVAPPDFNTIPSGIVSGNGTTTGGTMTPAPSTGYTEVTSDLYYSGGYLAVLKIPSLNVNVKVYQGTDDKTLAKGAGHFEDTSIWDGNCAIAGHNRGANCYFGEIHNLNVGDTITLTTRLGTRTYVVTSVNKISDTDNSLLAPTAENCVTLFTCVRNQRAYRWAVRAVEV